VRRSNKEIWNEVINEENKLKRKLIEKVVKKDI
jgi:hypothetical protein